MFFPLKLEMASMLFFNALASNGQHKPGPDSCLQGSKKEAKERELGWKEVNSFFSGVVAPEIYGWDWESTIKK